jgi:hypothetical protein
MPYQYPTPVGAPMQGPTPGAANLGMANRNSIAQALMNVKAPPPQMGGVPGGMVPPGGMPGNMPPQMGGVPGDMVPPGGGSGTAGPMPLAPPPPAMGPQYGTTGGTAGPMPLAPTPPGTGGPMPLALPQQRPMPATSPMLRR